MRSQFVTASPEDERFVGQRWAEPDVQHLRQLLRQMVVDRDLARMRGQRSRESVLELWDWQVVSVDWLHGFDRLLA